MFCRLAGWADKEPELVVYGLHERLDTLPTTTTIRGRYPSYVGAIRSKGIGWMF
jgi:hypothetical protein